MPHSLILGTSGSGKTTLALRLSAQYKQSKAGVLVLDPMQNPEWHADYITRDPKEFLVVVWRSQSCMIFVDEAGKAVGRYDEAMMELATMSRHWGHFAHFITQRGAQLSPTVRDQCDYLFLFRSSAKDGKLFAEEFMEDGLAQCATLQRGEYFKMSRFGGLSRHSLFGGNSNVAASDHSRSSSDDSGTPVARGQAGEASGEAGGEVQEKG